MRPNTRWRDGVTFMVTFDTDIAAVEITVLWGYEPSLHLVLRCKTHCFLKWWIGVCNRTLTSVIFMPVWFMVHQWGRITLAPNHPDPYIFSLYLACESVQRGVRKGLYVTMPGWLSFYVISNLVYTFFNYLDSDQQN